MNLKIVVNSNEVERIVAEIAGAESSIIERFKSLLESDADLFTLEGDLNSSGDVCTVTLHPSDDLAELLTTLKSG